MLRPTRPAAGCLTLALAGLAPATAMAAPTLEELQQQIEALAAEVDAQKAAGTKAGAAGSATTLGGYGEAYFKQIEGSTDEFDAYRLVLFVGHAFSEKLRFGSELEIEHAYVKDTDTDTGCTINSGGSDPGTLEPGEVVCSTPKTSATGGYVAVEQLFLQYDYAENHRWSAGQLLVPVGILNETHEPDTFYGVFRAPVEREIIPGTWFETGVMFSGKIADGVSYDVMASSGLSGDGSKAVKDMRQRGSKADGSDLAWTARVKYTGLPGTELGATWQRQTDMRQSKGALAEELGGDLLEAHVALNRGHFGLRALYARWRLDEDAVATAGYAEQDGWYVEPSWKITPTVGVFVRHSVWDNKAADSADSEFTERNVGVNWWLHERAVLKADLQFRDDPTSTVEQNQDGFNVGIGFSF